MGAYPFSMIFPPAAFRSIEDQPSSPKPLPAGGFRIFFDGTPSPRIESGDDAGRTYAEHRLTDLRGANAWPDTVGWMEEIPSFSERGFMLDISRCRVPTMQFLFRLVEWLEVLRFNQLQLYTEHTFAFAGHRTVWEDASPMTPSEIRTLDDYCRDHHIELLPNQNCFGHMERWLKHPQYRHLAECPDGFAHPVAGHKDCGTTLFPSPESECFVEEILSEVLPLYRSGKANVGGDEPWELGQGRSGERAGTEGKHEVYLGFLEKIFGIAGRLGKEPIFWADIILERPELVSRLPDGVIPAIWGYHPSHPYAEQCKVIAEAGFRGRFQVVPGTNTWNSFTGRLSHAVENIRIAADHGVRFDARGLVLTCWGDGGHHQSTASLFPSLILAGRAGWSADCDTGDLPGAIDALFYPGEPGGHGKAICDLGRIDELLPFPNHNQSFLHRAFFAAPGEPTDPVETVSRGTLRHADERLAGIGTENLSPDIGLSKEMSRWALHRCLLTKGDSAISERELGNRLSALRSEFRRVWLRDSREGGLAESLGRFPVALDGWMEDSKD